MAHKNMDSRHRHEKNEQGGGGVVRVNPRRSESLDTTRNPYLLGEVDEGSRERILVVEDDRILLELLAEWLAFSGFQVVTAGNGKDALELFLGQSFDLVLTDGNLPKLSGWHLAVKVKKRSPATPVLLVTGQRNAAAAHQQEDGSVDCLIQKPFRFKDISKTVQSLLDRRPPVLAQNP